MIYDWKGIGGDALTYSAMDLAIDIEFALEVHYDAEKIGRLASKIYLCNITNIDDDIYDDLQILGVMEEGPEFALPEMQIRQMITSLKKRETDPLKKSIYNCRICGYTLDFFPWGRHGSTPTFELCPCCGVQFGVMDETFVLIQQEREEWLSSGTPWFDLSKKPVNWDLEIQLAQIPSHYK